MSWFEYGHHTEKHIGLWLRYESNPDIKDLIKKSGSKRFFDVVNRVVVVGYDFETNEVWLSVWCKRLWEKKSRYNVFLIKTEVNSFWVCEGDLGRGVTFFD